VESAVIVRVSLPDRLDHLRRRCVADANRGVPGHVTLLYPFIAPAGLVDEVRQTIKAVASSHVPFSFVLSGPKRWPDTIYAAVAPEQPFLAIHRDLMSAFPTYPIYGRPGFDLIPHVTIADAEYLDDPEVLDDPSWSDLPVVRQAELLEVIAESADGHWRTMWNAPLGAPGP
jgi:2'-5' RNA ligase